MNYARMIMTALLLMTACTAPMSSDQLVNYLNRLYANAPASEFFADFGLPAGEFARDDGETVYRWVSLEPAVFPEEHAITHYQVPGGHYTLVDGYNGIPQAQYCELRIYTDRQGIIERFAVAVDSIGKWTASRCTEIFY